MKKATFILLVSRIKLLTLHCYTLREISFKILIRGAWAVIYKHTILLSFILKTKPSDIISKIDDHGRAATAKMIIILLCVIFKREILM